MRWKGRRTSRNIEDRRGASSGAFAGMGGAGRGGLLRLLPLLLRFLGVKGTIVVVLGLVAYSFYTGGDLPGLSGVSTGTVPAGGGSAATGTAVQESAREQETSRFVAVVLADTEEAWQSLFAAQGKRYQEPKLVLYRNAVRSGCGMGQAAMGPFYCPADRKVYLDLGFFDELRERHGAPGDFAQAYVIAHEIGHHVQTLLGISARVQKQQRGLGKVEANRLSVQQELQADCFAGIWANNADRSRQLLEAGDIEEGLTAASAIGDDRLQREAGGYVRPETFTHGSSAQRVRWFRTGLEKGSLEACDTFAAQ
ncbi:MAG TPA: hypothetical protein ENK49_08120 [Gammaproteobacteria bacterium]|nr:hypothetical protein [Gammaproteobacteria bacterium]